MRLKALRTENERLVRIKHLTLQFSLIAGVARNFVILGNKNKSFNKKIPPRFLQYEIMKNFDFPGRANLFYSLGYCGHSLLMSTNFVSFVSLQLMHVT